MSCIVYIYVNRVMIDYRLTTHRISSVFLDKLYTLGFTMWRYIAQFVKKMIDKELERKLWLR